MLNVVLAVALAVAFVATPPSALAGPGLGSTAAVEAVETIEDLDPETDVLVIAAAAVPAELARRFGDANAADPALAHATPPPVPPPERQP